MTDGLQPEYVDEPTCRVCGVAWADHPGCMQLCSKVKELESRLEGQCLRCGNTAEIEQLKLQLADANYWRYRHCLEACERGKQTVEQFEAINKLRTERNELKDACHKNKRKWRRGWKRTLDEIVRGWKRACNEKDAEIERLESAIATLISKSHQNAGNVQNPFAWIDQRDWEEFLKEVQDG